MLFLQIIVFDQLKLIINFYLALLRWQKSNRQKNEKKNKSKSKKFF